MANFSALYTDAQTDAILVAVADDERLTALRLTVGMDNGNSVDVGFTAGFDGAATPFTGHPGVAPGSGVVESYKDGDVGGTFGQDLVFSCEVPTGGAVRVSGSYIIKRLKGSASPPLT